MPKITIYTQAYNTKSYLDQCVSSVLSQTYTDFEYLLLDNGCTDGSSEILEQYAKRDQRIHLIKFEKNQRGQRLTLTNQYATGEYYAVLDSDDWWELDYLERLIGFLERNSLDLAVTGTIQHFETTNTSQVMRQLKQPTILTQHQFAQHYPQFWTFPSTNWATIMKTDIVRAVAALETHYPKYGYGGDTMIMLEYIKQCARIGIDNTALYHYRIHPKGVSYQYNPRRFDANIAYYEHIRAFLELHRTFDAPKREWLKLVHLCSMRETLRLLRDAQIPEDEKIAECARIAEHPLTANALTNDCAERAQWFDLMWGVTFDAMERGTLCDAESLRRTLKCLAPRCSGGIVPENGGVFSKEKALRDALRRDDAALLGGLILELIAQSRYTKQYDLGRLLCGLLPGTSPLRGIADARFYRKYARACAPVLREDYWTALDEMTSVLLENQKLYDGERFLDVYLSVAALERQEPAFLFGNVRLAQLLLREGQREKSRAIVDELAEMGLENEETAALRRELEAGT